MDGDPQAAQAPALRGARALDVALWVAFGGGAALALYRFMGLADGRSFDGSFNVGIAVWGQFLVGAALLLGSALGRASLAAAHRGAFVFFAAVLFVIRLP